MSDRILHVKIGPVQGFVAKARRTRDLWAGSFLLSWLAGQFMAASLRQNALILFPDVGTGQDPKDRILAAILGQQTLGRNPRIGSLPNRFKAKVQDNFDPCVAIAETKKKWSELAECVWKHCIEDIACNGRNTREIWDRQIENFWEFQWVAGEDPGDGSDADWLERRKNWHSHWPPEEGGDHCTTMGDLQEISGFIRSRERPEQDRFWNLLQQRTGRLELRDDERLCAIALVKRLFPRLEQKVLEQVVGWSFQSSNWPSTVYMAAVPWLAYIAENSDRRDMLNVYVKTVRTVLGQDRFNRLSGERATQIPRLRPLDDAADLDGNLFIESALLNPRSTPLSDSALQAIGKNDDPDAVCREKLINELNKLGKKIGSAQPFYALLLMDGDRLGAQLRTRDEQKVSQSLSNFVERVPEVVRSNDGMTVYAGGDDVLAMLPVDRAIECAISLREEFGKTFSGLGTDKGKNENAEVTASCAIIFTHYRNPLRDVLALAHKELDETAKDQNGRNSLAVAIMLPGGIKQRWVSRFGKAPDALSKLWRQNLPASFLYNLEQRYSSFLCDLPAKDRRAVVLSEYLDRKNLPIDEKTVNAEAAVAPLLAACNTEGEDERIEFQLEGAFIGRFLSSTLSFRRMVQPS